jgi:predicted ATPase
MTALERPYWIEALFERRDGWDASVYPFNLPVVRTLDRLAFHPNVTFLVGENGSGKSTLIEALAVAANIALARATAIPRCTGSSGPFDRRSGFRTASS